MKFLHLPKNKQFNMGTRFYDPQKEAMKEREDRIRREMGEPGSEGTGHFGSGIKGQFRSSVNRNSKTVSDARRKSNMRLLYIIIILSLVFYILLK